MYIRGMRNYTISLEHVTDREIEIHKQVKRATKKAAFTAAIKMSKSKRFKSLKTEKNNWGELPNKVRVWVHSDEDSNNDWEYGTHTVEFVDGKKTYETKGS